MCQCAYFLPLCKLCKHVNEYCCNDVIILFFDLGPGAFCEADDRVVVSDFTTGVERLTDIQEKCLDKGKFL